MNFQNISIKDIQNIDYKYSFFHYTNIENIKSIDAFGLKPLIGNSAMALKKRRKYFLL